MIYDCQSGANQLAFEILQFGLDSVVLVTEADTVCTKATKVLQYQFSRFFPPRTKYLVNKLFLKESATYRELTNVLKTFNYLPPIAFDFEVRGAFGEGRIPLDLSHPTAYL